MEFLTAAAAVLSLSINVETVRKCEAGILNNQISEELAFDYLDVYAQAQSRIWLLTEYVIEQSGAVTTAEQYAVYTRNQLAMNYNVSQDPSLVSDQDCIDAIAFAKGDMG